MRVNGMANLFRAARADGGQREKPSVLRAGAGGDKAVLSKQALAMLEANRCLRQLNQAQQQAENSPEVQQIKAMKKQMELLLACSKIAARLSEGDKVPAKDIEFLLKNDPKAYQMAMVSRKPKKDPKEWESALPEEEEEQNRTSGASGAATESAAAPEAASGAVSADGGAGGSEMGGGAAEA